MIYSSLCCCNVAGAMRFGRVWDELRELFSLVADNVRWWCCGRTQLHVYILCMYIYICMHVCGLGVCIHLVAQTMSVVHAVWRTRGYTYTNTMQTNRLQLAVAVTKRTAWFSDTKCGQIAAVLFVEKWIVFRDFNYTVFERLEVLVLEVLVVLLKYIYILSRAHVPFEWNPIKRNKCLF